MIENNSEIDKIINDNNFDDKLSKFTQNEQALIRLVKEYSDFSKEAIITIQDLNNKIIQLNAKNNFLENDNKNLRNKINRITNSKLGKIGIKAYKILEEIKNKLLGVLKK